MVTVKRETINKHREAFIGKFRFLDILGAGSTAVVYRCFDKYTENEVALKVFTAPGELHEIEILKSLIHSNIPKYYESGEIKGYRFISMQYIFGMRLYDCINDLPKLPTELNTKLILSLADTIKYIHLNGIVHCDISAGNIIISKNGEPYLTDFGIAEYSTFFGADISNLGKVWQSMIKETAPAWQTKIIDKMISGKIKSCTELSAIIRGVNP